ncbi:MAG: hypothetical protein HYZ37_04455 [Candidatus Solibacter usitatus]|nr:hypothetical protein [Candidatus Solibacter usitatus]
MQTPARGPALPLVLLALLAIAAVFTLKNPLRAAVLLFLAALAIKVGIEVLRRKRDDNNPSS